MVFAVGGDFRVLLGAALGEGVADLRDAPVVGVACAAGVGGEGSVLGGGGAQRKPKHLLEVLVSVRGRHGLVAFPGLVMSVSSLHITVAALR